MPIKALVPLSAMLSFFASAAPPQTFEEAMGAVHRQLSGDTCNDGNSPTGSGCCADTGECPSCCLYKSQSSSGSGTTCRCWGCHGTTVTIDSACTATGCNAWMTSKGDNYQAALSLGGCEFCLGEANMCFPSAAAQTSCLSVTPGSGTVTNGVYTCSGGGGGGGGGGSSNPCFPSSATVTRGDGSTARLDEIREGDTILALSGSGALTVDAVSLLSIAKPGAHAPFVELATEPTAGRAAAALRLTAEHHIPVGPTCCQTLRKASEVHVGDTVWFVDPSAAAAHLVTDPPAAAARVAPAATPLKIAQVTKGGLAGLNQGLHSPVLGSGAYPLVDGFVTAWDSAESMSLASYGLGPLLDLCRATGTCAGVRWVVERARGLLG